MPLPAAHLRKRQTIVKMVKTKGLSLRGRLRPWQSREGSCDFAVGFPVVQPGTARLPRPLRGLAMTNLGRYHFNGSLYELGVRSRGWLSPPLQRGASSLQNYQLYIFNYQFPITQRSTPARGCGANPPAPGRPRRSWPRWGKFGYRGYVCGHIPSRAQGQNRNTAARRSC